MNLRNITLCLLALGSSLSAQAANGDAIAVGYPLSSVGGGLFLIDSVKGSMTPLTGVTGDLKWAFSIDQDPYNQTTYYVGTTGSNQSPAVTPNIYAVIAGAGKVIATRKVNTVPLTNDKRILDLAVVGNEIWFLSDARLARVPVTGGKPTTITANIRSRSGDAVLGTDGRYVYINFDSTGFGRGELYQVDPTNLKHWALIWRAPQQNLDTIFSVELAADGQLLVMADGNFSGPDLHYVDITTGKTTKMVTVSPTHNRAWGAVEDPKTRDIILIGTGKTEYQVSTWRNGKPLHAAPYGTKTGWLHRIAVRRSPWLHRSGTVCLPSSNNPVFFANSVPEIGNAKYALTLTRKGSAAGILLIGAHGQLKNPVSLSGLGMTGCTLGLLPLVSFAFTVPTSGNLTLPLPIPSSLGRGDIDVQMVMTETGANKANLITGQVGSILVR